MRSRARINKVREILENLNFCKEKKRSKKKKVLAYIRDLRPHCQAAADTMSANGLQADTMSL